MTTAGRPGAAGGVGIGALLATALTVKTGSQITAAVNGVETLVEVARDVTVAVGDVLLVQRIGAQWFAFGRAYTAAPAEIRGEAAPTTAAASGRATFGPVETRSYRAAGWRSDNDHVYQGQYGGQGNHTGCAFYGNGPRSLAGATVTGARIAVHRRSAGGSAAAQTSTLCLITQRTRPAGAPTRGASTTGPRLGWGATNASFAIPASYGQAIVDGTAGGLGLFTSSGSPYMILSGRSEYGPSFSLTIDWRR